MSNKETKDITEPTVEKTVYEVIEEEVEVEKSDAEFFQVITSGEKVKQYTEEVDGFDLVVKFRLPNRKEKSTSDLMYSKMYNKLLQDPDQMTTNQLLELAKVRKLWSTEDENRLASIDSDIISKKSDVSEEEAKKKKAVLEAELAKLREEKFRLAVKIGNVTGTGIENIAEQEKTSYMLCHCIDCIDAEGEEVLLYPTRDDLDTEQDLKKLEAILLDAKSFWTGEGLTDFLHLDD